MSEDRTGTVRFILCTYSIRASCGEEHVIKEYCCTQPDVIKSGKYQLITINSRKWNETEARYDDRNIEAVKLGAFLDGENFLEPFSWARQKKKEERAEMVLNPCIECKFWKIRKEDLSKKLI